MGERNFKYDFLLKNALDKIDWMKLNISKPDFLFCNKNVENADAYLNNFLNLNDLFHIGSNGVQTKRDSLFIDFNESVLSARIEELLSGRVTQEFQREFQIEDSSSYLLLKKISNSKFDNKFICNVLYRPLDIRKIYYDKDLLGRSFFKMLSNLYQKSNVCLIMGRQGQAVGTEEWNLISISNTILDNNLFYRGGNMAFPLYLYPEEKLQRTINSKVERTPNLNLEIVNQIAQKLNLTFTNEKETTEETFAPIDILDYIYAVLHSPAYREKYKEFLKIDFPRVPYPKDASAFWQLVKLGGELRQIHLLESPVVSKFITKYPKDGNNIVTKVRFISYNYSHSLPGDEHPDYLGAVHINDQQYFTDVPTSAWEFYIGGYQPAQKWLKDRKGRKLEFEDILHYQKIIVALTETGRLMKEVDDVGVE